MKTLRRHYADEAGVDMTPMLDIVFILLIFFIVTATFLDEHGTALAKPAPSETPTHSVPVLDVYITAQNDVIVDGRLLSIETAPDRVVTFLSSKPQTAVLLRAHSAADLDGVVTLRDEFAVRQITTRLKIDRP
ncbi:ExbD/TolR family protein [Robiginitomaculum antarcticum]|uniref:ExbD/TolR family protein n=1 Tax=Robiginitomaculum antarcticum TaxID=437507 RepID=UPI00037EAF9F|nr:biopolymer transporter ExbD [Robiginitomaculum antarcticum]